MICCWKPSCCRSPPLTILVASPVSAAHHRRMWVERSGTRIIWKRWPIPNTRSTKTCCSGADHSIQNRSPSPRSINGFRKSSDPGPQPKHRPSTEPHRTFTGLRSPAENSRPIFATISNRRMKATLGRSGFTHEGSEWEGDSGAATSPRESQPESPLGYVARSSVPACSRWSEGFSEHVYVRFARDCQCRSTTGDTPATY